MNTPNSSYREISLTQDQVAIVDEADFEWLSQWKWYALLDPSSKSFYAVRTTPINGKRSQSRLHREIMGLDQSDKRVTDHINHDTLDNRRENLRVCTRTQNCENTRTRKNNKSGFKGVYLHPSGKWLAQIQVDGRKIHLGYRDTVEECAALYREAAAIHFGEFACTKQRT